MKDIIAGNLIRYRKALRLSQEALAEQIGITRQSINNYEKAKTLPDSKTLSILGKALGVSLDDLLRPENQGIPNFRFRSHASFKKTPQFATQVLNWLETYNYLEKVNGLSPYAPETKSCHCVNGNENLIINVATRFRHSLSLGDAPIPNLFETMEELGLKILRMPINLKNFFGLSACSTDQGAFVLINTHNISIERQLFTLAHEIGHLIFHRGDYQDNLITDDNKEEEKARENVANYFASHLLVPENALLQTLENIKDICQLKAYFRVSYTMILKRLDEMKKINYQDTIIKIKSQYKQKFGQPLTKEIELEPQLLLINFPENQRFNNLVWQTLEQSKISELKAAELLNLTVEKLRMERQTNKIYAIF